MGIDPRTIGREGPRFLGGAFASEHQPGARCGHVVIAELRDRHSGAELISIIGRILAADDLRQLYHGPIASLLCGHRSERPDLEPALTAATSSKFDDERFQSRREHADAEALQLAVPTESAMLGAIGFEAFDDAFGQFRHAK